MDTRSHTKQFKQGGEVRHTRRDVCLTATPQQIIMPVKRLSGSWVRIVEFTRSSYSKHYSLSRNLDTKEREREREVGWGRGTGGGDAERNDGEREGWVGGGGGRGMRGTMGH